MAYLKNWIDNFFQMFFMGTSWVAVSVNNIKTPASREMTSRKNIKIFDFNGVNVVIIEQICALAKFKMVATKIEYGQYLSQYLT